MSQPVIMAEAGLTNGWPEADTAVMNEQRPQVGDRYILEKQQLQDLFDALARRAYQVIGPTVRDGAIVYDELRTIDDLPAGWTDEQDGGTYRLTRRDDEALFGYAVGPSSWKRFLFPASIQLWRAKRIQDGFHIPAEPPEVPKFAFIGVRACELHAMLIQDKVFLGGAYADPIYQARREGTFIVAVNCGRAGGTCFCTSMGTGPQATTGFDLALTEVLAPATHHFVVEVGTAAGAELLAELPYRPANEGEIERAEQILASTATQMGRTMDTVDLKELLYHSYEHPHWDDVADRCLTCGNCTMVCPTCFCTTVEDVTDLAGDEAARWRRWDSCFTLNFSYIHGGSVRASAKARYRQWLTHKLATWVDQFGTPGCVGCGRCITWCPAAIDITKEVRTLRERDGA